MVRRRATLFSFTPCIYTRLQSSTPLQHLCITCLPTMHPARPVAALCTHLCACSTSRRPCSSLFAPSHPALCAAMRRSKARATASGADAASACCAYSASRQIQSKHWVHALQYASHLKRQHRCAKKVVGKRNGASAAHFLLQLCAPPLVCGRGASRFEMWIEEFMCHPLLPSLCS